MKKKWWLFALWRIFSLVFPSVSVGIYTGKAYMGLATLIGLYLLTPWEEVK